MTSAFQHGAQGIAAIRAPWRGASVVGVGWGWCPFPGDAVVFTEPASQIDEFATFTAKWTPALLAAPLHDCTAGWARHTARFFPGHAVTLDYAAGEFEFDILAGLSGTLIGR